MAGHSARLAAPASVSEASPKTAAKSADFVRSLDRGIAVIRAFSADHPARTASEVARSIGINLSSARRFLLTLADLGYVQIDGRRFRLSPKVLDLGYTHPFNRRLPDVAMPHLERLVSTVQESCSLSILEDGEIVYVAQATTRRLMRIAITVGTRVPAHATAMGWVLLAGQPDGWLDTYLASAPLHKNAIRRVRRDGYATADQELEESLRSIAAPIKDREGRVIAAINVTVHASSRTADTMKTQVLRPLLDTAKAIQDDLEWPTPTEHPGRRSAAC